MPAVPPPNPEFTPIPPVGPRPPEDTQGRLSELQQAIDEGRAFAELPRRTATSVRDAALNRHEKRAEKMRIPEWTAEEVDRMADTYILLSRHYLNPSFWSYVHGLGTYEDVYGVLDAVVADPHLLHYRQVDANTIELIPRYERSSKLKGLEKIIIQGNLQNGRITEIVQGGRNLIKPKEAKKGPQWWDWPEYLKIMQAVSQGDISVALELIGGDFPPETPNYIDVKTAFENQAPRLLQRYLAAQGGGHFGALPNTGSTGRNLNDPNENTDLKTKVLDELPRHGTRYDVNSPLRMLTYVYPGGVNEGLIGIIEVIPLEADKVKGKIAYTPEGLVMEQAGDTIDGTFPIYGILNAELVQKRDQLQARAANLQADGVDVYNQEITDRRLNAAWKLIFKVDSPNELEEEIKTKLAEVTDPALKDQLALMATVLKRYKEKADEFNAALRQSYQGKVRQMIRERYQPLIGH